LYDKLIPVVESKSGLRNLKNTCLCFNDYGISEAAFGHCDFNLDAGIFPFMHLDNDGLLNIVKYFADILNKFFIGYVNTPYLKLNNSLVFKIILQNIYNIVENDFSQITLCKKQTEICNSINYTVNNIIKPNSDNDTLKCDYAERIVRLYNLYFENEKGIALDDERELFSPHEYIAAKKYLESLR
jgi:hypothetical protein